MGRVHVKYLQTRSYKGQILLYWYPKKQYLINGKWQKCPFPGGEVKSLDEAQDLNKKLTSWRKGEKENTRYYTDGSVGWLVGEYKKDESYSSLSPSTQKLYQYSFNVLLEVFGDWPILEVTRKRVKTFYKDLLKEGTVRRQSQIMQNCRVVFRYARDEELINDNPFSEQNVSKAPARDAVWNEDLLDAVRDKAIEMGMPSIALAMQMGYDLGQRPQDLRAMSWAKYSGQKVKLKQLKTKNTWVEIQVLPDLKRMLDETPKISPIILIDEATKKPYSKDMLCRRVREVMTAAGIGDELQFRDLRRTAVVRLMDAGATLPEICSVTGHKLTEAEKILEVYGPRSSKQADNAIDKVRKLKESLASSKEKSKV